MEVCCRWCLKVDTCDHVDEWVLDEEGMHRSASEVESCPDFVADPEFHAEILCKAIQATDPVEYTNIGVELVFGGRIDIAIVTKRNFTPQESHERILELQEDLQEINDEILHIIDADFYVSFMYPREDKPGSPAGVDEDGDITEAERALDRSESNLKDFQLPGGIHRVKGDEMMAPQECPICNTAFKTKVCPNCGYEPEDEDSWKG